MRNEHLRTRAKHFKNIDSARVLALKVPRDNWFGGNTDFTRNTRADAAASNGSTPQVTVRVANLGSLVRSMCAGGRPGEKIPNEMAERLLPKVHFLFENTEHVLVTLQAFA